MNTHSRAFVNTDSMINWLFGHSRDKATIQARLSGQEVITSWYVLMEYQLTVVHGFVFFYHVLRREKNLDDALVVFGSDYRSSIKTVLSMIIRQLRGMEGLYHDKEMLLNRLEIIIKRQLVRSFKRRVSGFVGTEIWRKYAEVEPTTDLAAFQRAFRPEYDLAIPQFLMEQKESLNKVIEFVHQADLKGHPKQKEAQNIADLCHRLVYNPQQIIGKRQLLNRLSDLLIAIDAPEDARVYAFDRIFEILCQALGKEFNIFPSWRVAGKQ